jgi:phosphatidylserine decarboxylase
MVRDGIYYALGLTAAGLLVGYLAGPVFGSPLYLLAAFCLYFFRDPDRVVPVGPVAVSPADGKVVIVQDKRVSIFLNIFDVHVNRSPIAGKITRIEYKKGKFVNAAFAAASSENEQNVFTVEGEGTRVVFSQIAGLIARRIVCYKKQGDMVEKGERVGLIKFGSRVDVFFGSDWEVTVTPGQRVSCGSSILARRKQD